MNYAGTFPATFPSEGHDTHSHAYAHVDSSQTHAPADAIIVPDAQLLFHADYSRSGTDLILSRDHHEYVVHDYFHGEKRAPLASPDGAHLTADIVTARFTTDLEWHRIEALQKVGTANKMPQ